MKVAMKPRHRTEAAAERDELYARPDSPPRARIDFVVPRSINPTSIVRCRADGCGRRILFWPHPTTGSRMVLDVDSAQREPDGLNARLESHFAHCAAPESFRRTPRPNPLKS